LKATKNDFRKIWGEHCINEEKRKYFEASLYPKLKSQMKSAYSGMDKA